MSASLPQCPRCKEPMRTFSQIRTFLDEGLGVAERETDNFVATYHDVITDGGASFKIGALTGIILSARGNLDCLLGRCKVHR